MGWAGADGVVGSVVVLGNNFKMKTRLSDEIFADLTPSPLRVDTLLSLQMLKAPSTALNTEKLAPYLQPHPTK